MATDKTCQEDPSIREVLRQLLTDHVQAHYRQDADGAAALYADDLCFISPGSETRSRQAQRDAYAATYRDTRIVSLEYLTEDLRICGPVAHEPGYVEAITDAGGNVQSSRWRCLIVWEQREIGWKLARGAAFPAVEPHSSSGADS